jgi:hypothetical protein
MRVSRYPTNHINPIFMKSLFYTLVALCFTAFAAQAQYVLVSGQVLNTNGTNITINLSLDSITYYTTYSDSTGYFYDTIPANSGQGVVIANYVDCNGVSQSAFASYNPGTMTAYFTIDWCPNTGNPVNVIIYGQIDNITDSVMVTFLTDMYPNGITTWVIPPGNFVFNTTVNALTDPITAYFTDCNGDVQTTVLTYVMGTVTFNYSADYCPGTNPNPCGTLFTATYDAPSNTFTLTMDSAAPSGMLFTYAWDFGDGSTSNLANPSHTYAVDGIYNVCVTISNLNGFTCTYCHEIGIDSTGGILLRTDAGFTINVVPFIFNTIAPVTKPSIDIYPNPVTDNALVNIEADKATTCTITLTDATGRMLRTFALDIHAGENVVSLPAGDLANGLYLVTLQTAERTTSRSFVK